MAHQNVTDTAQVEIQYYLQNNNASNVMHVSYVGGVSLSDLDALAAVFVNWLSASWEPISNDQWTANQITITDLNSASGPRKAYPIDPPIAGDLTADPIPANATLAIKQDIGTRGRGTAGRTFWVGLDEGQVAGNQVDSATVAAILTAMSDLNAAIVALSPSPWQSLCVPHRTVNKAHPNPALSSPVVGFLATNNLIDSQKDRLPFHKKRGKK